MIIFFVRTKFSSDKFPIHQSVKQSKSRPCRNEGAMNFFIMDSCIKINYKVFLLIMFVVVDDYFLCSSQFYIRTLVIGIFSLIWEYRRHGACIVRDSVGPLCQHQVWLQFNKFVLDIMIGYIHRMIL